MLTFRLSLFSYYNLQLIADILGYGHVIFWGQGRMKNRLNILCLNTVQLSTQCNNIFRGRVGLMVGAEFVGAEFVWVRDVPESFGVFLSSDTVFGQF